MWWDDILFGASIETLEISGIVGYKVWDKIFEDEVHKVKWEG